MVYYNKFYYHFIYIYKLFFSIHNNSIPFNNSTQQQDLLLYSYFTFSFYNFIFSSMFTSLSSWFISKMLPFMSFKSTKKGISTFVFSLALVSMKGIPYVSANSFPSSKSTFLSHSKSHLQPTSMMQTFSGAPPLIYSIHFSTFLKESLSFIAYAIIIPIDPL